MLIVSRYETAHGEQLREIRARLHANPELSMEEYETTAFIREYLVKLGIEVIDIGLQTGVIGLIRGAIPGKTIALRADIDALPVRECIDNPVLSRIEGRMHACGHDVHTTMLLGAAMQLADACNALCGNVLLIFQPAEENIQGARAVMNAGLFERFEVSAVMGLHVKPELDIGTVGIKAGPIMSAKDGFSITVHGHGGHGAMPHKSADPIVAGAALIGGIQAIISRNMDPKGVAVVSVCSVHAGDSDNIIPDSLSMLGGIRSCSEEARQMIKLRINEISHSIASAYSCTAEVEELPGIPVLVNDAHLAEIARSSATQALGEGAVKPLDFELISEDFALYAEKAPIFFYFLGTHIQGKDYAPLHSPGFYPDERVLCMGAALMAVSARNALEML